MKKKNKNPLKKLHSSIDGIIAKFRQKDPGETAVIVCSRWVKPYLGQKYKGVEVYETDLPIHKAYGGSELYILPKSYLLENHKKLLVDLDQNNKKSFPGLEGVINA